MSILAVLTSKLFLSSNAEFFEVSHEQRSEGYTWEFVGKTEASGAPALTIQPDNGNEWILYRLEK